jgi:hypothetical protein
METKICTRCGKTLEMKHFNFRKPPRVEYKDTCNQCRAPMSEDARFWSKVSKSPDGCWEWTAGRLFEGDYGAYRYQGRTQRAHRVSWEMLFGKIPEGFVICHACDNPRCVRPEHLFLGTHKDNMQDMVRKGRARPLAGEHAPAAKLSKLDVSRIRRRYAKGKVSQAELAEEYALHPTQISRIINGRKWKHSFRGIIKPIRPIVNKGTRHKKGEINPLVLCDCGCGERLSRYDRYGRPRKYIRGHSLKRKQCDEQKTLEF